jgi:hypothetical protein
MHETKARVTAPETPPASAQLTNAVFSPTLSKSNGETTPSPSGAPTKVESKNTNHNGVRTNQSREDIFFINHGVTATAGT